MIRARQPARDRPRAGVAAVCRRSDGTKRAKRRFAGGHFGGGWTQPAARLARLIVIVVVIERARASRRQHNPPAVAHITAQASPSVDVLHLEQALQLLAQSGREPPPGEPGSQEWLQGLVDALVDLSSRDVLTGLANRRSFDLALAREVDRVARSGEAALLLMLDIDHFKRVNDTWGHVAGDQVLRAVAVALQDCVRPMDLVARIGGEEFAIILPNCPALFGATVAERVRRRVEHVPVTLNGSGQQIQVTISIGGAFAPQWVRSTPALWVERADQQLYRAKAQGRNLVQLEASAVSLVSNEERQALFDTFSSEDHE
ncbi:MAG: GGDEF domain-containing protein [Rubrivivax sp.]|nr:GGDEF domain-containing protein [Rubrivivax sp.]